MNERKDERWLDDQLLQIINGSTPRFDAEAWKRKHRDEYQALLARGEQPVGWGLPHRFRMAQRFTELGRWLGTLAAAAVILLVVDLLMPRQEERPPISPTPTADPAGGMMSMMSLRLAYQRGGFDALDRQLQDSLDVFQPRSLKLSMQELLNGIDESENRKG
jgi:hypothetical protein